MGRDVPSAVRMSGTVPVVVLQVRPIVLIGRGDIRVEARVPRHADNRLLAIAWVSDHGSAGSTQRLLEGADAPVLHTLALPSQPPANYFFTATVFGGDGSSAVTTWIRSRVEVFRSMTRRLFLQAIPSVLPLCHPSQLPPLLSLSFAEWEEVRTALEAARTRTVMVDKAVAILRAAVREPGPQIQQGKVKS